MGNKNKPKGKHRQGISIVGAAATGLGTLAIVDSPSSGPGTNSVIDSFEGMIGANPTVGYQTAADVAYNLKAAVTPGFLGGTDGNGYNDLLLIGGVAALAKGHKVPVLGKLGFRTKHHFFRVV